MSQHSQYGHHHHHPHSHPAVLHNASLAEIASQPASSHHYSSNLGSAVASSMHLTNSTSETDAGNTSYKMEHDMMYYSVRAALFDLPTHHDSKYFFSCFHRSKQTRRNWITPTTAFWTRSWTTTTCRWWTWRSMKVSRCCYQVKCRRLMWWKRLRFTIEKWVNFYQRQEEWHGD